MFFSEGQLCISFCQPLVSPGLLLFVVDLEKDMAHGSISVPFVGHKRLDKRKPKQTEALQNDATKWYLKHAPKKRFIVAVSLTFIMTCFPCL